MDRLLTVKEVADKLRVAPASIYHWLNVGRLSCIRFSARCVRLRESEDIAKLVEDLGGGSLDSVAPRVPGRRQTIYGVSHAGIRSGQLSEGVV
jgi:hypothetical protein